ncbi:MAG: hypothetical protein ABL925_04275, partial [Methylococcales bacterium]
LVPDQGERLDAHMGFKAGGGEQVSKNSILLYAFFLLAGLYVVYLSHAGFKRAIDGAIAKIKS